MEFSTIQSIEQYYPLRENQRQCEKIYLRLNPYVENVLLASQVPGFLDVIKTNKSELSDMEYATNQAISQMGAFSQSQQVEILKYRISQIGYIMGELTGITSMISLFPDMSILLNGFSMLQGSRIYLKLALNEGLLPICSPEFSSKHQFSWDITDEKSLVFMWMKYLSGSSENDLFTAIHAETVKSREIPRKEGLRLYEILSKTDNGELSRSEQIELDLRGYTRDSLNKYCTVIEKRSLTDPVPEMRELYAGHLNDLSSDVMIKSHMAMV